MLISNLRDEAIDLLDAGIAQEWESAPGRGKSTMVEDLIDYMSNRDNFKWGLSTCFLATETPTEMMGYTFKGERWWDDDGELVKEGTKGVTPTAVTEPTLPRWMMTTEGKPVWAYRRGILLLDEYGQGEADTKRASAQLLLKGELGPFKLPGFKSGEGWGIIACTNGTGHRSGVTKAFDFVINRRAWIGLTDDIAATIAYLSKKGLLPLLLAFAEKFPQIVLSPGVPEKQGPWMTPRTLEMVSDLLKQKIKRYGEIPTTAACQEAVAGLIGVEAAMQVFNYVRLDQKMPKFDTIVANPDTVKVPDEVDAKMIVCYDLAARVTEKNAERVLVYVDRLGKEFATVFAKAACGRMPLLIVAPSFVEWSRTNSSLINLMQSFA